MSRDLLKIKKKKRKLFICLKDNIHISKKKLNSYKNRLYGTKVKIYLNYYFFYF